MVFDSAILNNTLNHAKTESTTEVKPEAFASANSADEAYPASVASHGTKS